MGASVEHRELVSFLRTVSLTVGLPPRLSPPKTSSALAPTPIGSKAGSLSQCEVFIRGD